IRVVVGITTIVHALIGLRGGPQLGSAVLLTLCIGLGFLVIAGLWTPIVGALLAITAPWGTIARPESLCYCLLIGTLGVALALLGPGMWSLDAHFFGWKRLEIRDHKKH